MSQAVRTQNQCDLRAKFIVFLFISVKFVCMHHCISVPVPVSVNPVQKMDNKKLLFKENGY